MEMDVRWGTYSGRIAVKFNNAKNHCKVIRGKRNMGMAGVMIFVQSLLTNNNSHQNGKIPKKRN